MEKNDGPDLNKIGLFREMSYLHGSGYTPPVVFNESAHKNKQILSRCSKSKAGNQDGYFDKQFVRIFEGESYNDPIGLRRKFRIENEKKNRPGVFKPTSPTKKMCGLGSNFGTFDGYSKTPMEHFSPVTIQMKKVPCPGKNFLVNPAKKGSGYGYPNVTITNAPPYYLEGEFEKLAEESKAKQVELPSLAGEKVFHLGAWKGRNFESNPFRTQPGPIHKEFAKEQPIKTPFLPTSPAKKDGGMKAGCLSKFPEYMSEPYVRYVSTAIADKEVVNSSGKRFVPVPGLRMYPIRSTVDVNVKKAMNSNNCKTLKGVVYCKDK